VEIELDWPAESLDHIYKHGVSQDEVDEFFRRNRFYLRKVRDGYVAIGRTNGRFLMVAIVRADRTRGTYKVVTARDAEAPERDLFKRRRKGSQ
jgi:uncharacterized DUF497 family protein